MNPLWTIPAGLAGAGLGFVLGKRVVEELEVIAEEIGPDIPVRNFPQPHAYFRCHWCDRLVDLDDIEGVMVDHDRIPGGPAGKCNGSGKVPHV